MTHEDNKQKPAVAAFIDSSLKKVYDDLVEDDLPDRFKELLDQLKSQESNGSPQDDG